MVTLALRQLHAEMSDVLAEYVEPILASHGVGHWKLTLVARNPAPGKDGEWTVCTNEIDLATVARTITGTVKETIPAEER